MKQNWLPEELTQHWTLSSDERELLGNKAGATRLRFVVLLKAFQLDGRFPERREEVAANVVAHLASQTGVPTEAYSEAEWSERTQRYQRAQIRQHCDFRIFRVEDEPTFVAWLSERVSSPNPEDLKIAAYNHLRLQRIEPPPNGTAASAAVEGRGATRGTASEGDCRTTFASYAYGAGCSGKNPAVRELC
jgi:Domain of unknown function (DUF4158)